MSATACELPRWSPWLGPTYLQPSRYMWTGVEGVRHNIEQHGGEQDGPSHATFS